jgi:hypothetical protein
LINKKSVETIRSKRMANVTNSASWPCRNVIPTQRPIAKNVRHLPSPKKPKKLRSWGARLGKAYRRTERTQTRESSDRPILNAFCRIAPSERFSVLAIREAFFFWRAMVFKVRTCSGVHARRFVAVLAIKQTPKCEKVVVAPRVNNNNKESLGVLDKVYFFGV